MVTLKKIWQWISTNSRYVILGLVALGVLVLMIIWGSKNKKIKDLQGQLALMQARIQIDKLLGEYNVELKELTKLMASETKVKDQIQTIENSLTEKLSPGMTTDQIVEQFKKLGIRD